MPVVEELNGEQEKVKEEGCGQCHEKQTWSWCSLKVTLLLQKKKKSTYTQKWIFSFSICLDHYRHRFDKVLAKRKLCFYFLRCHGVYEKPKQ